MDYPQEELAITHHADPVRIGGGIWKYFLLLSNYIIIIMEGYIFLLL
jgi:hypothetical protein